MNSKYAINEKIMILIYSLIDKNNMKTTEMEEPNHMDKKG